MGRGRSTFQVVRVWERHRVDRVVGRSMVNTRHDRRFDVWTLFQFSSAPSPSPHSESRAVASASPPRPLRAEQTTRLRRCVGTRHDYSAQCRDEGMADTRKTRGVFIYSCGSYKDSAAKLEDQLEQGFLCTA